MQSCLFGNKLRENIKDKNMYLEEIERLDEITDDYKAIICDIWGVLHNGRDIHQEAVAALRKARAKGKRIILLTNAPKCSDIIQARFAKMGVADKFWDETVTSGDCVRDNFAFESKKVFHWGLNDDRGLYEGTSTVFVDNPENADLIVCTGLLFGTREIASQEVALLQKAVDKKIPLLCANPDKSVQVGDHFEFCAGALADIYVELGGNTEYFGKPYPAVYHKCFDFISALDDKIEIADILAIGDGLYTDIKGAQGLGLDVVFIKYGLHSGLFKQNDFTELREICEEHDVMPEFVMDMLR